jgi:anion-transporting  ArsA/GET3 family ATPase
MRVVLIIFIFCSFLFAEHKSVKIGKIDKYYKGKITKSVLEEIIKEIESDFQSQLGFDVFDMASDGKPIDLLYVKPSMAQKRLDRYIKKYDKKVKKKEELEKYFPKEKKALESMGNKYDKEVLTFNEIVKKHNDYIVEVNSKSNLTQNQYNEIKQYETQQQRIIKLKEKKVKKIYKTLKSKQRKYNRNIASYNNLIRSINTLAKDIENLSRSIKVVKGNAISNKEITKKIYKRDGKIYKVDMQEKIDEKIEIYGFESLLELKAVIAHEIGHLVGIPHISDKGALMNPILQENQKRRLELTKADIKNFNKYF